jgi:hypothetical protein
MSISRATLDVEPKRGSARLFSLIGMCASFMLSYSSVSLADQCNDILSGGLWDINLQTNTSQYRKSVQNWFCRRTSTSSSFSFGYSDLDAAYQNAEKTNDCGTNNFDEASFNTFFGLLKTANESIVAAWNSCMNNQSGLVAYPMFSAADDKLIVAVAYKPLRVKDPNSVTTFVRVVQDDSARSDNKSDCVLASTGRSAERFQLAGQQLVFCKISADKGATVFITGDAVIRQPIPISYKPPSKSPPPLRTTFYAFGDKSLDVGFTNSNAPEVIIYNENRQSGHGLLIDGSALIPEAWPGLGVGILLPSNSGIYWPSTWKIWSARAYDIPTVKSAIVGDWIEPNFQPGEMITSDGGNLVFHRPTNAPSGIVFTNPLRLVVPLQGNMVGLVMPDLKMIIWSYGAVWYRK